MAKKSIIAAMSENRVIGIDNRLPWNLPADWENFWRVTHGKAFLMGRMTYITPDALISPYRNVILTSKTDLAICDHCQRATTLEEGMRLLQSEDEIFILGGASVYAQTLGLADYLYLTVVHHEFEGDAFFPEIDWTAWELVSSERHEADDRHAYAFTFFEYQRKTEA
jgi:dihydrofolate reductase